MPRYVDADFAPIYLNKAACEQIKRMPTVKVGKVKHASWTDKYGGKYDNRRYVCSACQKGSLYDFEKNELGQTGEVQQLTPYCPNCGAKMDGKRKENK